MRARLAAAGRLLRDRSRRRRASASATSSRSPCSCGSHRGSSRWVAVAAYGAGPRWAGLGRRPARKHPAPGRPRSGSCPIWPCARRRRTSPARSSRSASAPCSTAIPPGPDRTAPSPPSVASRLVAGLLSGSRSSADLQTGRPRRGACSRGCSRPEAGRGAGAGGVARRRDRRRRSGVGLRGRSMGILRMVHSRAWQYVRRQLWSMTPPRQRHRDRPFPTDTLYLASGSNLFAPVVLVLILALRARVGRGGPKHPGHLGHAPVHLRRERARPQGGAASFSRCLLVSTLTAS